MIKVLVVEDDKWLAEHFVRVLNNAGYDAQFALNPVDAMDEIDDYKPDVLILDVLLTGNTVFAMLHELQSYEDTAKLPIVLCTNLAADLDIEKLRTYGVRRIVDKTKMQPEDLVAAVRSTL
jgi:CheY-like chemotaxis protein